MANYAYLCVSDHDSIYPAFADESYDSATNTVATCASNVPLLWFALFRPADLVTRTFDTDDGPWVVTAPITGRETALANLRTSLPRLNGLFAASQDPLDGYAELLAEAVGKAPGRYATIEWDEIAVITEGDFVAETCAAMTALDPGCPFDAGPDGARLLRLSGIGQPDRPLPPARYLVDRLPGTEEDDYLHSRLIGVSHVRTIPRER